MRAAEALARRIGPGVDDQSLGAAARYLRLGSQDTGCHYPGLDEAGMPHEAADPCRFLMKTT